MDNNYYHTKESVQEYIRLAKDANGESLIKKLRKILPPKSKVLEIGSGPGTDWKILNESYRTTGSDNSDEFLKHLTAENPTGKFLDLDAKTLMTNQKFDGIYSNKVMHHLKDNELSESIDRQHAILNSNGIICHSFWKGEGSETFKGLFVNYHTKVALEQMFRSRFKILSLETYKEFEEGDSLLLIGRKK
ncbi:class I SAM-dependent methyltransferase [Flagellimonas flava]|uniref:class I SAM-dependent methyltransferase n=1 Tax=Flagellimonas flava TaxID=570519 RepID=UPI003D65CDED